MRITLIGAGNVASCIGPRLKEAGHEIASVYSRTAESARALAERLDAPYTTVIDEIPSSPVTLVMLKDEALMEYAPQIVHSAGESLFVHTAGSVPMELWHDAGAANYGVLYPMQTFSHTSIIDWDNVPLFIEGSCSDVLVRVRELAFSISRQVATLSSQGRRKLHLAAVFVSNFSNHMCAISERILAQEGVPFSVMMPLLRETASKLERMSPSIAQTGPAVRGDSTVVEAHLRMLEDYPEWRVLYRLISLDINESLELRD